ncbi:hypothetical protein [Aeromonas veronii]|uniref:hypothetical protein n=1 Tax=Aeromonas veronii TaxID=654 RepID=UPI0022481995|nr:hypothetical protein [Aeromonas veronii]MCX0435263.1 hypothetical protein [Aeromonas veronii]
MTPKKAKTGYQSTLRPLLPLEYCTVERASLLLECEVEDLLHWAKLGFIHLYIDFDHSFPYYCQRVKLRDGVNSGDLIHARFGFRFDPMLSLEPIPAPKDDLGERKKPIKLTWRTQPLQYPTEPSPWGLTGLWGITSNYASCYIKQYISGITGELHSFGSMGEESAMGYSEFTVFAEQKRLSGAVSYDAFATVKLKDGLIPPAPLIINEDLAFLHQRIHSGERLEIKKILNYSIYEEEADSVNIEKPPHHTAVALDNARAGVLAAALHLVAKNPDILKTEGQLAEVALGHRNSLRDKSDKRNIRPEWALNLVKEAINTGGVFKNQPKK